MENRQIMENREIEFWRNAEKKALVFGFSSLKISNRISTA
jgi:hypothetical protein